MKKKYSHATQGSKVSEFSKAIEGHTSFNNNKKTNMFRFTTSSNFKAQIAKKFREYYNVREAEESSLPMDGKTIPGFNIRGTEEFFDITAILTDIATRIEQSNEATRIINEYYEDYYPEYLAETRNRIILNIAMLEAGVKFSDDDFSNDVEAARRIYKVINNPIDQLINRKRNIEEDFLIELYDSDVIPGDTAYYTGDSYVDMEANEFLASTAVIIMAYTPTREILAKQALQSENATMYVTHVSRLVSLMFGGTMTSVNTNDENHIVNVARKIFFMLDDKLE